MKHDAHGIEPSGNEPAGNGHASNGRAGNGRAGNGAAASASRGCDCRGDAAARRGATTELRRPATAQHSPAPFGSESIGRDSQRPVMITGGAGFVGTNLAARMLDEGRDVLVFDNLSRPGVERNLCWLTDRYKSRVRVEVHDIRDALAVRHAVARSSMVFHLAAQVAVTHSLVDPQFDFDVNARGTLNVLEACRGCSTPPPLLFTSTNKVYGSLADIRCESDGQQYQPTCETLREHGISEQRTLEFHSPYGCSKGAADQYVLDYARCYDLPAVVFRMSCIYGPHQCGTEDQGWLAHFARRVLTGEPLSIYGDGQQVRDVLFVSDLVEAMLAATDKIHLTAGQPFNIGGGPSNAVSLLQVIDRLTELEGSSPEAHFGPWRQGDQKYYVSDTRRFQATTGWAPRVNVDEGIAQLWQWMREATVAPTAAVSV